MSITFGRHPEDPELLSSVGLLEKINEDAFWIDVTNWLNGRIELHNRELQSATDMSEVIKSQAIIANCQDLLDLPAMFITELTNINEDEED